MPITRLRLERFTAFEDLDFRPSPGINVLVGANGTGKTHLMKMAYAACDVSKTRGDFAEKIANLTLPSGRALGRLTKRRQGSSESSVRVYRGNTQLALRFSNHTTSANRARVRGSARWTADPVESVYVPVQEMLANAPGFRSLYEQREIHFEEVYRDILDRAHIPPLRGRVPPERRKLLDILQKAIDGKVYAKQEEFFLRNGSGDLEFSLLAEGMRKLGLLWLLIRNGTLLERSVLFWDEPETNLNPKLFGPLIEIFLELQRMGVQIFLATHDYVILKEFDLRAAKDNEIVFHALFRDDESGQIDCNSVDRYLNIHPLAISEVFEDLYDREIRRGLKRGRK